MSPWSAFFFCHTGLPHVDFASADGPSRISELLPILLLADEQDGLLLMLRAYFADSGSHADSEIVTIGGVIGTRQAL
jgi:hypothetical protein